MDIPSGVEELPLRETAIGFGRQPSKKPVSVKAGPSTRFDAVKGGEDGDDPVVKWVRGEGGCFRVSFVEFPDNGGPDIFVVMWKPPLGPGGSE